MRRVLASAAVLAAVAVFIVLAGGASSGSSGTTYKIVLDNAFGLVKGADFKVAGVPAGKISSIDLPQACINGNTAQCRAVVTVSVTQSGFGSFRSDAFCQSRPQSLIGEYFIDCQPGAHGTVLKNGATIPVTQTQSTIPADLLVDIMRMPYRERLTLIINELGAAVAARSGDLQAALQRAVPALTETDNLLNLLANDSATLQALTANSNSVITTLANNSKTVQNFIDEADAVSQTSATQQANIAATWKQLPGFLEQLRPVMAQLGGATSANLPVVENLNTASGELARFFRDLPGFSHQSLPAIKALGQASVTGKEAATAATPTVTDLNRFAKPTPELAQNLAIVLHDLDDRNRAVEPDSRSPGGKGYTGLEALLQYVFNQTLAINTFGTLGHMLAVDIFIDPLCSPYASPQTIAANLATYGAQYRRCYSWLGPNQPGINEPDPTNPGACVPDPGGQPDGVNPAPSSACKLQPSTSSSSLAADHAGATAASAHPAQASQGTSAAGGGGGGSGGQSSASGQSSGQSSEETSQTSSQTSSASSTPASSASAGAGSVASQAQQLLNYLLAP